MVDTISNLPGPVGIAIANIPPCATPSDRICIETTRIFDSCSFEEEQQKTFKLPYPIEDKDIQCEIIDTESSILDIIREDEQQDLVNVKLRIKVVLGFIRKCSNDSVIERVMYFNKNITLTAPEGADISCDINNATCECIESSNLSCNPRFFDNIRSTVKVAGVVKSKKLAQIEIPLLGNCEPEQCCPCEGIPVAPGKSLTLPNKPSEVSRINFSAKTNPGTTSRFIAFLNVIPYTFSTVTDELKQFEINLPGGQYPIENISLKNLGKSTIYVYDLTVE